MNKHIYDIVERYIDVHIEFAIDSMAEQIEDSIHLDGALLSDKTIKTYIKELKKVMTNKLSQILNEKGTPYLVKLDGFQDKIYCDDVENIDNIIDTFSDSKNAEKIYIGEDATPPIYKLKK